ncbi:MAG TPA: methylaspartate ammonia-lyase [Noviherbaspirillum sp.]|uniref:methylaspartate ammonia-lyase n=1 Tax=Noviherbaspirillum sp. TaxID=1926288 RepID=UPI002B496DFA|nr:methylaspartate ammonia-lyase [Noviherbaspirillum sp.]HJV88160.1 methylaspartate ammonia-lyase [Noviherbaspirillum sp.]
MKITRAMFVRGLSSFYFDDQAAIKGGARQDGFMYVGNVHTPGFSTIRQAGECVSVLLELENGCVAVGDCAAVQYSGAGGRDPLFLAETYISFLDKHLRPLLEGRAVEDFVANARYFDAIEFDGKPLHTAIRYGVSQALLDAAALAGGMLKTEVICDAYGLPVRAEPIPLFGQSGDDRYAAVDKMILKGVNALPHGLINNVPDKLGYKGEKLQEYLRWLVSRIGTLRASPDYFPDLHIDVYGTVGLIFDHDPVRIADYLAGLEQIAKPFNLYIEGPVDAGEKDKQMHELGEIKAQLTRIGAGVRIVADEWCNTYQDIVDFTDAQCCHMVQIKTPDLGSIHNIVESVLYCNKNGMEAYQGGTCNETDISARTCVHLALAARPVRMLVKPGMGFDEGMNIVNNEMQRAIATLRYRQETSRLNLAAA